MKILFSLLIAGCFLVSSLGATTPNVWTSNVNPGTGTLIDEAPLPGQAPTPNQTPAAAPTFEAFDVYELQPDENGIAGIPADVATIDINEWIQLNYTLSSDQEPQAIRVQFYNALTGDRLFSSSRNFGYSGTIFEAGDHFEQVYLPSTHQDASMFALLGTFPKIVVLDFINHDGGVEISFARFIRIRSSVQGIHGSEPVIVGNPIGGVPINVADMRIQNPEDHLRYGNSASSEIVTSEFTLSSVGTRHAHSMASGGSAGCALKWSHQKSGQRSSEPLALLVGVMFMFLLRQRKAQRKIY